MQIIFIILSDQNKYGQHKKINKNRTDKLGGIYVFGNKSSNEGNLYKYHIKYNIKI